MGMRCGSLMETSGIHVIRQRKHLEITWQKGAEECKDTLKCV